MKVQVVLHMDAITAEYTVTVGYFIQKDDHILLLNEIIGEDGDPQSVTVIPNSLVLKVDDAERPINLTLYKGGKDGGKDKPH